MSVYVDNMKAKFGPYIMCHMAADSTEELLAMAIRIDVNPRFIQDPGTHREHFDITLFKRVIAIKFGAKELTMRELSNMMHERRTSGKDK